MTTRLALALDIGTSGIRGQAIDLASGEILSTAITTRHPLPGANVVDHLHFALELGIETAGSNLIRAINRVIGELHVATKDVERIGLCGNPIQLSLFQGIEVRDLAFSGKRKLESLGIVTPNREGAIVSAKDIPGLSLPRECDVIIPPAIRNEVGADALAMMIQTGMLDREETSIATDFGTNAEVALSHEGKVFTGSTAAGPAIEGRQITCGMLAAPSAVSDVEPAGSYHRLMVLDAEMFPVQGPLIDFREKVFVERTDMPCPVGITGTGVIAAISQAIDAGLIALPRINTMDNCLHLGENLYLSVEDLGEAGKAIGAIRAGHITLCTEAGITPADIQTAYMSGASGTYVDARKAQKLGMIPPCVEKVYQVGNTSLAMARDLVTEPKKLDMMAGLAGRLRQSHCTFAESETFRKIFVLELSHWTEGMPMSQYRRFLKKYGFPHLPAVRGQPVITRTVKRDIADLGRMGLTVIPDIGRVIRRRMEGCTSCMQCVEGCPEKAISAIVDTEPITLLLDESLCRGVVCRHCERTCPARALELNRFFLE